MERWHIHGPTKKRLVFGGSQDLVRLMSSRPSTVIISLMNCVIQQSRSFEGFCVPLRLTSCLFPVLDSQHTATELFQSPPFGSGSTSHPRRHFPSSALAWRHTSASSSNCVIHKTFVVPAKWHRHFGHVDRFTYLLTYVRVRVMVTVTRRTNDTVCSATLGSPYVSSNQWYFTSEKYNLIYYSVMTR